MLYLAIPIGIILTLVTLPITLLVYGVYRLVHRRGEHGIPDDVNER